MQFIFFGLVIVVYGLLNYYIGLRGLQSINSRIPINKILYWIIIFIFSSIYFVGLLLSNLLPQRVARIFETMGGYWLAAFVYLLCFVLIIDVFRLLANRLNIMPGFLRNNTWFIALAVVTIVAVTLGIGTYKAIMPKVTKYDISIDKKAGNLKELKCAMISDVHLGEIIGRDRLHTAVTMINSLEPDLVVVTGDLIDQAVNPVKQANMLEELKSIKSRFGTYFVMGNHEYFDNADEIASMIEETGVTVLRDEVVKINDSFYLAGREDKTGTRFGFKRSNLDQLLKGVDKELPVIVLDHQPSGLDEPRKAKVDLQLSGHTHAGQFFPANLVTDMIFEEDNGYLKDGSFNLVVSCGYGTWGPTVRIGSQSEVVDLKISFAK